MKTDNEIRDIASHVERTNNLTACDKLSIMLEWLPRLPCYRPITTAIDILRQAKECLNPNDPDGLWPLEV